MIVVSQEVVFGIDKDVVVVDAPVRDAVGVGGGRAEGFHERR